MARPRLQIHLSTAVVLSLAIGALLWANTADQFKIEASGRSAESFEETSESFPGAPVFKCNGWPFQARTQLVGASVEPAQIAYYSIPLKPEFHATSALKNALVGLGLIVLIAVVCEIISGR